MKLSEAIQKVIKTKENETDADIDDFSRAVNADVWFGWNDEWSKRVKGYWLVRWICTDTWVGRRVYLFDGEPIAVSYQSARKSDEYIEFLSNEAAIKIRNFLFELKGEEERPEFDIADQEKEIEEFYNFDLTDYFIERKGFVDDRPVDIINERWFAEDDDKRWVCEHAVVRFEDGEERVVHAEEIHFPLRVEA